MNNYYTQNRAQDFYTFREVENDFELLPEFEIDANPTNGSSKQRPSQTQVKDSPTETADPATGWERDNESFTKRAAELHLKNFYRLNEKVTKITNCFIDPDFFIRRCDFTASNGNRGAVLWIPVKKQVHISICLKGKKLLCSYDYFTGRDGELYIKNRSCLSKTTAC